MSACGSPRRARRCWASSAIVLCAVVLLQLVGTARAAVLAIDLGSEFLKISIVKPGRTPISIVLNEM